MRTTIRHLRPATHDLRSTTYDLRRTICDLRPAKTGPRGTALGFTLLEVVVAMAILALFIVPLLGAISHSLNSIGASQDRMTALRLAQDKMTEIEMMKFPEAEESGIKGDFGKDYPGFSWEMDLIKSFEIEQLELLIPGIQGMEVHLWVHWQEGGGTRSLKLATLILN